MKLYEYMKLRNGIGRAGTIKFAMTAAEFNLLGIEASKGWVRKYRNLAVDPESVDKLLEFAVNSKKLRNRSLNRLSTNFQCSDNKLVYLMYKPTSNSYKIGISNDPKTRQRSLSSACGEQVELIAAWKVAQYSRDVERELHIKFKQYRLIGEWFRFDYEIDSIFISKHISCQHKRVV